MTIFSVSMSAGKCLKANRICLTSVCSSVRERPWLKPHLLFDVMGIDPLEDVTVDRCQIRFIHVPRTKKVYVFERVCRRRFIHGIVAYDVGVIGKAS